MTTNNKNEQAAKYGRVIHLDGAKKGIIEAPSNRFEAERFVRAYEPFFNPEIGLLFQDSWVYEYFIIGKSRYDAQIEGTLRAGQSFNLFSLSDSIRIGLQRRGEDTNFKPRIPKAGLLYSLGLKGKTPKILNRDYGATISSLGLSSNSTTPTIILEAKVSDKKLKDLTRRICNAF